MIAQAAWHRCASGVHRAKIDPEDLRFSLTEDRKMFFFFPCHRATSARLLIALGREATTYREPTIRRRYTCFHLFSSWNNQGHREIIMQITVMLAGIPAAWRIYRSVPCLKISHFSHFSLCVSVCPLRTSIFALSHIYIITHTHDPTLNILVDFHLFGRIV